MKCGVGRAAGVGGQGGEVAKCGVALGQGLGRVGEERGVTFGDQGLVQFDERAVACS